MATHDPQRIRLVSKIANLERWHPDDPELPRHRAELTKLRLRDYIRKELSAVSLNPDQRAELVQAVYANLGND